MTIQFNCPNCDAVIGFEDKHRGKRAQCTTCGQRLIIPTKAGEKAKKVEPEKEDFVPESGFFRALFIESPKLFIRLRNVTGMVFVTAAVCFKFFTGHVDYSWEMGHFRFHAPVGFMISLGAWGCLFWYYMEIICSTAIDVDDLPDIDMGGFFGFIWNIVKSLFIFAAMLVIVQIPCIIFILIEHDAAIQSPVVRTYIKSRRIIYFSSCNSDGLGNGRPHDALQAEIYIKARHQSLLALRCYGRPVCFRLAASINDYRIRQAHRSRQARHRTASLCQSRRAGPGPGRHALDRAVLSPL